ncbi:MAG: hypothetical protein ACLRMZ_03890 [Blautia marasmi]
MEEGSGSRASYGPFSNAVCGQAVSAEKGGEILYADAMGQAIRTASEGKGPPFRAGRVQERGLQSVEKEKIAYHKEDAEHGNSQKRRLCSTTKEDAEHGNSQKRRLCSTTKEDAEHVNSQKRRLCSTTGEEAEYSSGIKTGDKGTSGYEKDMESGQMSGTGQNSGLETGEGKSLSPVHLQDHKKSPVIQVWKQKECRRFPVGQECCDQGRSVYPVRRLYKKRNPPKFCRGIQI